MRNYVRLGGWLYAHYMYFDIQSNDDFVADSLFYKREIPVKFTGDMAKDGDKYMAVFCKVKRKYKDIFEEALDEIPHKMSLLGHNDYEQYCHDMFEKLEVKLDGVSD